MGVKFDRGCLREFLTSFSVRPKTRQRAPAFIFSRHFRAARVSRVFPHPRIKLDRKRGNSLSLWLLNIFHWLVKLNLFGPLSSSITTTTTSAPIIRNPHFHSSPYQEYVYRIPMGHCENISPPSLFIIVFITLCAIE